MLALQCLSRLLCSTIEHKVAFSAERPPQQSREAGGDSGDSDSDGASVNEYDRDALEEERALERDRLRAGALSLFGARVTERVQCFDAAEVGRSRHCFALLSWC